MWASPLGTLRVEESGTAPLTRDEIEAKMRAHFECNNPLVWKLAVDVYEKCIFGRMQAAEAPLKHAWLIPGGVYVGQWIWDTTFLTDLLAVFPEQRNFIRGIYQNFWDSQDRWSAAKPEEMRGMVANFIAPDSGPKGFTGKEWMNFPAYSQAPLLAWGVERVYLRNGDKELVRAALPHLERFHDWYWRERDVEGIGLVAVGCYDGDTQHARFETYDNEVDLDALRLTPHPGRALSAENGAWYGDIMIPANTSYLLNSEQSLVRLAEVEGDHALAARRRPLIERGCAAMRALQWDETAGCFLAVARGTHKKASSATIGGMVPLQAGVPDTHEAKRMAQALASEHWNTPVPLPSVDRSDPQYKSDGFWRGDVWPSSVYQTVAGLAAYGHTGLAGDIAGRLIENAMRVGISEHYDSQTGTPLGVPNLGMSAVLLTMALEGLSPKHRIQLKQ